MLILSTHLDCTNEAVQGTLALRGDEEMIFELGCAVRTPRISQMTQGVPARVAGEGETIAMRDPLATYIHDHLGGAVVAITLLTSIRDQYAGEPLGQFAAGLLVEVEADRKVLQDLAVRVGTGTSMLKKTTAWLGRR